MGGHSESPVGLFDSGVGGLSVLAAVRDTLPNEDLVYLADSGHAPYGDKSVAEIEARAMACAGFLLGRGAKAIVIACNTATVAAARALRSRFAVPIVAMEPGVKPAVASTRSGVVGVLATRGTVQSERFQSLLADHAAGIEVVAQACPGLVEQVERGLLDSPETVALLRSYVEPLLQRGADTLVLGCTHYPFLRETISRLTGPGVQIIDTGPAVARQLRHRLAESGLLARRTQRGSVRYFTSGDPARLRALLGRLGWGECLVSTMDHERA